MEHVCEFVIFLGAVNPRGRKFGMWDEPPHIQVHVGPPFMFAFFVSWFLVR